MRNVLVLTTFVTAALAITLPAPKKFTKVGPDVVTKQRKILELFETISQLNPNAEYYKVGSAYNLKDQASKFKNKEAFNTFWKLYTRGDFKYDIQIISIFDENRKTQAKSLYELFYNAIDFDTFYKTAAWARVHINGNLFAYTLYIAVIHSKGTADIILPPLYEIWPQFYANTDVFNKIHFSRIRGTSNLTELGIVEDGDQILFHAKYSNYYTYANKEHKLSYFYEDIDWNAQYAQFHSILPFWEKGDNLLNGLLKKRRGEFICHYYQQLLARIALERESNCLGDISKLSWDQILESGYRPFVSTDTHPFVQRSENYVINNNNNLEELQYIRNYESTFLTFLEKGKFEAYNQSVDLSNSNSINFVGNYWQANSDLYEKSVKRSSFSYGEAARHVLRGAYDYHNDDDFMPSVLDFYQSSLRDPVFYQLHNKIFNFIIEAKKQLPPYNQDSLQFNGVRTKNFEVSNLSTFFELSAFNATNAVLFDDQEMAFNTKTYSVAHNRINHESFSIKINVDADVDENASIRIFIGPKYDGNGFPIKFEIDWMKFVELDWLTKGDNVITRRSEKFFNFKEESSSTGDIDTLETHTNFFLKLKCHRTWLRNQTKCQKG